MEVSSIEVLNKQLEDKTKKVKVVYFFLKGTPECQQMTDVVKELMECGEYSNVAFLKVDAEQNKSIAQKLKVESVPSFLFYVNEEVERLVGANAPALVKMLKSVIAKAKEDVSDDSLNSRLERLINKAPCMLFMKGSPEAPKCGFSNQIVQLLATHNAAYKTFDILQDSEVREGLKEYSNWPTYPQLYVNGELIGGLDIIKELDASHELGNILPKLPG